MSDVEVYATGPRALKSMNSQCPYTTQVDSLGLLGLAVAQSQRFIDPNTVGSQQEPIHKKNADSTPTGGRRESS